MTSSSVAPSPSGAGGAPVERADVIVVGAGPGGSATAAYLADHGLDVVLLEKSAFPRDKICGDGLTPRATKELISLGVDTTGWQRTKGLRIKGGGHTLQLDWPESDAFPGYGMVRTRAQLDETLARHAESRGRPAARAHERLRPGPRRLGPRHRRHGQAPRRRRPRHRRDRHLPRPRRRRERRRLEPPRHRRRPPQARGPRHGRGRPRRTTRRPEARRLPREPPRAVEPRRRRQPHPHARLRLALPARGRPHQRRPRHARHDLGLPEDRLQGRHASLGRGHQPRVAARARRVGRPDPRRRAADGLQPHPALRRRPAPRRRLRRHGQPLQRRGHRLRPRGRAASAPSSSPRRWRARATPRASGCSRHTPRS